MTNEDPAFQLLARASGYLEAARIVVDNGGNKPVLRAPIAHLIAHGLEVLMKHVLVVKGFTLEQVKKDYGHDLSALWKCDEMKAFQEATSRYANKAWAKAKESGKYEDDFAGDPTELINDFVVDLGRLHSAKADFPLRYVAEKGERAPVPLFLLDTFWPLKDDLAREYSRSARAQKYA